MSILNISIKGIESRHLAYTDIIIELIENVIRKQNQNEFMYFPSDIWHKTVVFQWHDHLDDDFFLTMYRQVKETGPLESLKYIPSSGQAQLGTTSPPL